MVKPVVGKFYKTRSVEKVECISIKNEIANMSNFQPVFVDTGCANYPHNGVTMYDLIEEWRDEPEITVGSLWSYNNDPSLVVKIIAISGNGKIVCEVVDGESEVDSLEVGEVFVFNESNDEAIVFTKLYKPYVEKQKLVGYMAVVSSNAYNNGKPFFCGTASNEEEAKTFAESLGWTVLDIIKIEWKER